MKTFANIFSWLLIVAALMGCSDGIKRDIGGVYSLCRLSFHELPSGTRGTDTYDANKVIALITVNAETNTFKITDTIKSSTPKIRALALIDALLGKEFEMGTTDNANGIKNSKVVDGLFSLTIKKPDLEATFIFEARKKNGFPKCESLLKENEL